MIFRYLYILLPLVLLSACSSPSEDNTNRPANKPRPTYYGRNISNMARLITYDIYGQKMSELLAVYIAPDVVVAPFDDIKEAVTVKLTPMENRQTFNVFGYVSYDLENNLVALRVGRRIDNVNPVDSLLASDSDTLYTLTSKKGKILRSFYADNKSLATGTPVFNQNGNLAGIVSTTDSFIQAPHIFNLRLHLRDGHDNITDLRLKTNKVYPSYKTVSACRIITTMGNITIRLFNETPRYRDNFIKLVCDNFYDSLLIHRVLPNYLIQTGAADSKYAGKDDLVGWKGPGYKLPMQLVDGIFHRRGMIAASKLPSDLNSANRSDGSQFFIVAGRKFTDADLNEIERDYHKHFTAQQREAYKTIGGAPYLDGDYTIFAEVISGMDIVDKIAAVKVNGDRPIEDIRIKDIVLIRK